MCPQDPFELWLVYAAASKSLHRLCNPIDGSPPSSADPGMTCVCVCVCIAKEHFEQEEYYESWENAVFLAYSINGKKVYRSKVEWVRGEVIGIKKQVKWEMLHHGMFVGQCKEMSWLLFCMEKGKKGNILNTWVPQCELLRELSCSDWIRMLAVELVKR